MSGTYIENIQAGIAELEAELARERARLQGAIGALHWHLAHIVDGTRDRGKIRERLVAAIAAAKEKQ